METDPSGTIMGYKADCIGGGRETVMELFEKEYKEDMDFEEALMLGLKAIDSVSEEELTPVTLEIGYIKKGGKFTLMSEEEVTKYVEKYKSTKKEE